MSYPRTQAAAAVFLLTVLAGCARSDTAGKAGATSSADAAILEAPPCARDTSAEAQGMPSEDRIYNWIRDLTLFGNRRTGHIGGKKAAAYMKCKFESLGLQDVHYETAPTWMWDASNSSLSVTGQAIDSSPVPFTFVTPGKPSVFSTPPGGLDAEIVDLGLGLPIPLLTNVQGKIVVFDLKFLVPTAGLTPLMEFLWDPTLSVVDPQLSVLIANPFQTTYNLLIEQIVDAGAVGFVGVLADYFDSNRYYNESYHLELPIPGVWVSPKDGKKIRDLMSATSAPHANMVMQGRREETLGRAVVGTLPGKSMDTILVTSHHDSAWNGAVEDASGAASVIAQAQYFASQPADSREKTLLFTTMDSHWTGYQVHEAFARKYILDKQTPYNIVGNVTIEHIGKQGLTGADGKLEIVDQPEFRGIFENLGPTLKAQMIAGIIKHDLRRTAMLQAILLCPTVGVPTDAFACVAGVPTASLISGPNYLYDEADTLDKVAKDQLVPVNAFFAELVENMDATPSALIGIPLASPIK